MTKTKGKRFRVDMYQKLQKERRHTEVMKRRQLNTNLDEELKAMDAEILQKNFLAAKRVQSSRLDSKVRVWLI